MFNITVTAGVKNLQIRQCFVNGWPNLGLVNGFNVFQFFFTAFNACASQTGITYEDITLLSLNSVAWFDSNTGEITRETLTGTIPIVQILGGARNVVAGATQFDITNATVTVGNIEGGAAFEGDGTPINGTIGTEWEIEARGVDRIYKDSAAIGGLYISSALETVISTVDTYVKLLGTTTLKTSFRFDANGVSNRLRYIGTTSRDFTVNASITLTSASNNKTYTLSYFKNDSEVTGSAAQIRISSGDIQSVSMTSIVNLSTNDYVEVWIENNTDTTNPTAQAMGFTIV